MPPLLHCGTVATALAARADQPRLGWVSGPNQRGTMDIIWSCVATLIICLWTMLHLNLPAPDDTYWTSISRKARWLLLGLLAPELPMLFAFAQWASATRSVADMKRLGYDGEAWSLGHAFYADAGGFVLHPLDSEPFPLTAKQLKYLIEQEYTDMPAITAREIWDKSKVDRVGKTIACLQAAWLTTQIISRAIQGLAVTPLELFTIALTFSALTTLCFWLCKPLSVDAPTAIKVNVSTADILIRAGDAAKEPFQDTPLDFVEGGIYVSSKWSEVGLRWMQRRGLTTRPLRRIPDDRDWMPSSFRQNCYLGLPVIAFASIHLLGWNLSFPTPTELFIWRFNSLLMCGLFIAYGNSEMVGFWKAGYEKASMDVLSGYKQKWPWALLFHVPSTLYFCSRVCLFVEVLLSLRSLPASAFQTVQWSQMLPHI